MSGRRVILPGQAQRRRGLPTILVPRGLEEGREEPMAVCRVPVGDGEVCGKPFFVGEERAFQRHVGECARAHMDEIREESPRTRFPVFDEAAWDPEAAEHLRGVGKRMLAEGRLEMLPNERIDQ